MDQPTNPTGDPSRPVIKTYALEPFSRIKIDGPAIAGFTRAEVARVVVTALAEDHERIEVKGGRTLDLSFKAGLIRGRDPAGEIRYDISGTDLDDIELGNDVTATISGVETKTLKIEVGSRSRLDLVAVAVKKLEVDLDESASATIAGSAAMQEVTLEKGAIYDGSQLESDIVEIEATDGATATIRAKMELDAEAVDGASISYIGAPGTLSIDAQNGGTVTQIAAT